MFTTLSNYENRLISEIIVFILLNVLCRPLLKLMDKLLMVGIINDEDLDRLLVMIDPQTWDPEKEKCRLILS